MRPLPLAFILAVSLLLPGHAFARGGDYGFVGGTPAERAQVHAALGASSFDWSVVPAHVTVHLRAGVPTSSTRGHIWVDSDLLSAGRFSWAAVQDEYAHQVDFFVFDDFVRSRLLRALGGTDWCYERTGLEHEDYGCERFASTLVWAYWPSKDNAYRPKSSGDESAAMAPARFRRLVADVVGVRSLTSVRR